MKSIPVVRAPCRVVRPASRTTRAPVGATTKDEKRHNQTFSNMSFVTWPTNGRLLEKKHSCFGDEKPTTHLCPSARIANLRQFRARQIFLGQQRPLPLLDRLGHGVHRFFRGLAPALELGGFSGGADFFNARVRRVELLARRYF